MICPGEQLEAWVRGDLRAEVAAAISRHVERCEACRREAAWLRAEHQAFAARRMVHAPSPGRMLELRRSIERRLEAERRRIVPLRTRARAARIARAFAPGIAAVLLALVLASILRSGDPVFAFGGSSCVSMEMQVASDGIVAPEEEQFGACLMASPRVPPGSSALCL